MNTKLTIFYFRLAVVNFIILTVAGLLLRYLHIGSIDQINYQFLLHAHSHFAFSGWIFFAIALLVIHLVSPDQLPAEFRWVLLATLVSAYGMLVSFYLQGYKAVSIIFSTLFIVVTYRFTYLVIKNKSLQVRINGLSYQLIRAALFFLCLSSVGPLALGPLMAMGFKHTPYYQDAIYIYLHFQMNGFMLLAAWGLLASSLSGMFQTKASKVWAALFIYSTIILYFIFTLWSNPGIPFQLLAAVGAIVNMISWLRLCITYKASLRHFSALSKAALIATTLKIIFQLFVCIPAIGNWTFANRDLIIGYIHLLTLGIITPLIFDQMIQSGFLPRLRWGIGAYLGAAITYLAFLFLEPLAAQFGISIPGYQLLLFVASSLFLFIAIVFLAKIKSDTSLLKRDKGHFFASK
ncbi:MAG: hypothetical protein ACTHNW_08385 [Mucilaginibacter sp.]